jgi:o-succinylbenzoate synthase
MDAELERATYRFRHPVATAYGTLTEREVLVLRLRDEDGNEGLGEAAPLAPYDGVTLEETERTIRSFVAALPAFEEASGEHAAGVSRAGRAPASAALDTALADREARSAGRPLSDRGPQPAAGSVPVNATIVATDRAGAAREAAAAVEAGFETVKLKVGVGDDAGRVAAVRAAIGADVAIRIDANGAWEVDEAVAALRSLAPAGIECCEEPVHGVAGLAALRERLDGEVAIAMDETTGEDGAVESGACDLVCLKVAGCGGVTRVWAAADRARSAGSRVYVASTYDGPVGIAAGLHAAAALGPDIPACGLATLTLFEGIDDPFPVRHGRIEVPRGPGLGVSWPVG